MNIHAMHFNVNGRMCACSNESTIYSAESSAPWHCVYNIFTEVNNYWGEPHSFMTLYEIVLVMCLSVCLVHLSGVIFTSDQCDDRYRLPGLFESHTCTCRR